MKKIITLLIASSVLLSSSFIYANEEEKDLNEQLEKNRQEQMSIDEKAKSLNSRISEIEANISSTNEKIVEIEVETQRTEEEIKELEEEIVESEESLGKRLKVINSNYSIGYLKVILSSTSISDFFDNIYIVKQVVEQDKELLKELDKNKEEVESKKVQLDSRKKEQEELKLSLEQDEEMVKQDKAELDSIRDELLQEEKAIEAKIEEIIAAQNVPEVPSGGIIGNGSWPVPGHSRVSSPYGYRNHPILNTQEFHTGIDIPAPQGTPATAIDAGTVIYSGPQGTYGNTLMIQHDDGKVSLYAHNSQLLASVGQRVEKGQAVTLIGSTGMSTGPHLHFEIRINGKHTNPMSYL